MIFEQLLKPESMSFAEGAAIPEQWFTAFQLLHLVGEIQPGDNVLIHAGASGVGTSAIQLCRLIGAGKYFKRRERASRIWKAL